MRRSGRFLEFFILVFTFSTTLNSRANSLQFCLSFCCQLFNQDSFILDSLSAPQVTQEEIERKYPDKNRPIVIVSDAWKQINGVVNTLENMKKQIEELGYKVVMMTPDQYPHIKPKAPVFQNVAIAWVPEKELDKVLAQNPNAIHVATPEGSIGGRITELLAKREIPFTTGFHTQFAEYLVEWTQGAVPLEAGYAWTRALHRNSEAMLVTTTDQATFLAKMGLNPSKMRLWGRGIDTEVFKARGRERNFWEDQIERALKDSDDVAEGNKGEASGSAALDRPPTSSKIRAHYLELLAKAKTENTPIEGYVGRVTSEKNLESWFKASTGGLKIVVGPGADLQKYAKSYPDVIFLGAVQDKALLSKLYEHMDVFVFPSTTDTFGNVQLEAAATGTPVAALSKTKSAIVVESNKIGVTSPTIKEAIAEALKMKREDVTARVQHLGWRKTALEMLSYMTPLPDKKK